VDELSIDYPSGFVNEPICVSDWRHFFKREGGRKGLFVHLVEILGYDKIPRANLQHEKDGTILIRLKWPELQPSDGMINQLGAGDATAGNLSWVLHELARWGDVRAFARFTDQDGSPKRLIAPIRPSGFPYPTAASADDPGFEVVFSVCNYYRQRGMDYADSAAGL
jgi:hypothetical protein